MVPLRRRRVLAVLVVLLALTAPVAPAAATGPPVEVAAVVRGPGGARVERWTARGPAAAHALAARLRARHGVTAEVSVPLHVLDEPQRPQQWALDRLAAEGAWTTTLGRGVTVAVVDSGVDATHHDLAGAVLPGLDLVDPGRDGRSDVEGHGTAVAGVVAAALDGYGIAGLAPEVAVLPVRVVEDGQASSADVAEGLVWAVDHGADVVNLSLGGDTRSAAIEQAVAYAAERGVLVVAAAGNAGHAGNPVIYPAASPGVLGVGATDQRDAHPSFSSYGAWVDVAAPGVGVLVAVPLAGRGCDNVAQAHRHEYCSGTSFAAPYVAASAALLLARNPGLTPGDLTALLVDTADDVGAPGPDAETGAGVVQPVAALAATPAGGRQPAPAPATPEPTPAPSPAPTPTPTPAPRPAPAPSPEPPPEVEAPDPVRRVAAGGDAAAVAVALSREAFPAAGSAEVAVLGRDDVFADTLAGAALTRGAGPLLYAGGGAGGTLPAAVAQELRRALSPRATVFLLGGTAAVSPAVEAAVGDLGFPVRRLSGEDRFRTAAAVAAVVDPIPERVLLARGDDWADAVTGGAAAAEAGVPVLLTPPDALHPAAAEVLGAARPEAILLGGTVALSAAVEAEVASRARRTTRVAGADRVGTAVAVARALWPAGPDAVVAVEGYGDGGWSAALAAAPLSAVEDAPQLLVPGSDPDVPGAVGGYLDEIGTARAVLAGPGLTDAHADAFAAALAP